MYAIILLLLLLFSSPRLLSNGSNYSIIRENLLEFVNISFKISFNALHRRIFFYIFLLPID